MRHRLLRPLVPALLAGAALVLGTAAPAAASEEDPLTAVARTDGTARTLLLGGTPTVVRGLQMTGEGDRAVPAFSLSFSRTPFTGSVDYTETTWDASGQDLLARAQWVILNGYPTSDRAELIEAAGVQVPPRASAATVNLLLRLGTQAAIWKRVDNVSLGAWRAGAGLGAQNEYAVIKKVYDYLSRPDDDHIAGEPLSEVKFEEPGYVDAPAFFVHGPGGVLEVDVENGYAVTDARFDGGTWKITKTVNGGGLRFVCRLDGDRPATLTVTAEHAATPGLLFKAGASDPLITPALSYGPAVSESLERAFGVCAGPVPPTSPPPGAPTSAPTSTSSATPSTAPTQPPAGGAGGGDGGGLPVTGAPIGVVLGGGLVLLAAGAVVMLLVRRRRLSFTS